MSDAPQSDDLLRAQRRESIRIGLGLAHVPVIELPESLFGEYRFFHLVDLSEGGLSFESPEEIAELTLGAEIPGCVLEFSAVERISLTVTPRHVMPCTLMDDREGYRYGCQIAKLSSDSARLIRRTLISREQRQIRIRSKFT